MHSSVTDGPELESDPTGSRLTHGSFHPEVAKAAAREKLAHETRRLLRARLKAVAWILLLFLSLMLIRAFFVEQHGGIGVSNLLLVLLALALVGILHSRIDLSLRALRMIEVLAMGSAAVFVAVNRYRLISGLVRDGNLDQVSDFLSRSILPFVILILIYGIFLPNSWKRAAYFVVPAALAPIVLHLSVGLRLSGLSSLLTPERISSVLFPMGLVVFATLYGTHIINTLRVEAFEARQLGNYTLVDKIGSGAMGEVWRANHQMLARPVAIKLIRPEMLGARDREAAGIVLLRFGREARATAELTSAHSIMIHDFGISSDGAFYYVMELLDGLDLGALVERFGPVTSARTIHFLLQACESLSDAHYHNLIHRDIKPSNIFTCHMGRIHDFVKVLDFGLVKTEPAAMHDATKLTGMDVVTGTPAFMAPEQAIGEPVDARSDVYSLGCVAYWLVTGGLVFETTNPTAMLVDHVKTEPIPPSQRTEEKIPADLEKVILACLRKKPDERPASAEELSRLLSACEDAGKWGAQEACQWWEKSEVRSSKLEVRNKFEIRNSKV